MISKLWETLVYIRQAVTCLVSDSKYFTCMNESSPYETHQVGTLIIAVLWMKTSRRASEQFPAEGRWGAGPCRHAMHSGLSSVYVQTNRVHSLRTSPANGHVSGKSARETDDAALKKIIITIFYG